MKILLTFLTAAVIATATITCSAAELPERSQIAERYKWNLADIYATQTAWESDYKKVDELCAEFPGFENKLKSSADMLYRCLQLRDQSDILMNKLYQYARLKSDENIADNTALELVGRAQALNTKLNSAAAFITPEITGIPPEKITAYIKQQPGLTIYSFYFSSIERQKPHILDQKSEQLIAQLSDAGSTPATVYNILTGSDIKFPEIKDENGNTLVLSPGQYSIALRSADRETRKKAFLAYNAAWQQYRNTLAQTLNDFVHNNCTEARLRNYPSALAAALDPDMVPLQVYDNLIKTVNNNLDLLHHYMKLRKKVLNLPEMHVYDLYVPLLPDADKKYDYSQAEKHVYNALAPLGSEYNSILVKAFNSRWIDVYETRNKRSGAYSWGPYGVHPYILLNYEGHYDDVSTVAHELGHSLHSYYSNHNQPFCTSSYSTFAAETASTVNEILLADYMLQNTDDVNMKISILNEYLEQIRGTVFTQVMFAEFEKQIYSASESGQILTAEYLDKVWHNLLAKYYGNDVIIDKETDGGWARVPHFYRYFYVYQYATGYSAATDFADKIQSSPLAARRYIDSFLKAGGSAPPVSILKNAGVDMTSSVPVETVMTKFCSVMDGISELLNVEVH